MATHSWRPLTSHRKSKCGECAPQCTCVKCRPKWYTGWAKLNGTSLHYFLLVTIEHVYKIKWFLAGINYKATSDIMPIANFILIREIRSVGLGVCPMQPFHFWSCDVYPVQSLLLCTKFHENPMIFHWDMTSVDWGLSSLLLRHAEGRSFTPS